MIAVKRPPGGYLKVRMTWKGMKKGSNVREGDDES
jgi:hypothetical protein